MDRPTVVAAPIQKEIWYMEIYPNPPSLRKYKSKPSTEHAKTIRLENELGRRSIQLKRIGWEMCGPCPVCGGRDRFAIHLKRQLWNCRGCGRGGDVIELVRHIDGISFNEAVRKLAGDKGTMAFAKPVDGRLRLPPPAP
jgi:hypothetical protein